MEAFEWNKYGLLFIPTGTATGTVKAWVNNQVVLNDVAVTAAPDANRLGFVFALRNGEAVAAGSRLQGSAPHLGLEERPHLIGARLL